MVAGRNSNHAEVDTSHLTQDFFDMPSLVDWDSDLDEDLDVLPDVPDSPAKAWMAECVSQVSMNLVNASHS